MPADQPDRNIAHEPPPPRAKFRFRHLAVWLPACAVHGVALAWLAFGIQKHFAPLILFPLMVGLALGITLAGLLRLVQVAGRSTILLGALVAWTATVVGQHAFAYQEQREAAERQASEFRAAARAYPDLVRGTPPQPAAGLVEFLRWQAIRGRPIAGAVVARGAWAWASWLLDAAITLLAALGVLVPAAMQPYCDRCGAWYRTVRRGRIESNLAGGVAAGLDLVPPECARAARYRLVSCPGGCAVSGLEICWEKADGRAKQTRIWISPQQRARLAEWLDTGTP